MDFFETDDQQTISNFILFMRRAPDLFAKAGANVLNTIAFSSRKTVMRKIKSSMTVRNERFIKSTLLIDKARKGQPLYMLASTLGTVEKPRYSGLEEQITGGKKQRVPTMLARGGSKKKQVRTMDRLRPAKTFLDIDKYQKAPDALIAVSARAKRRKVPFIVKTPGKHRLPPGLYKIRAHKILMLQSFKSESVKRINWMEEGVQDYFDRVDMLRVWTRATERVLPKKI